MVATEVTAPTAGAMSTKTSLVVVSVVAIFAIVYRVQWIGNPLPYEDEQFYLLVANRIWHGGLPYVDIWDRKPIGLFLLYAAFVPFGGFGLVAYQVGALLATIGTSFILVRIAVRYTTVPAAVGASFLYIIYLQVLGGQGGQSPVFYNVLMSAAALLVLRIAENRHDGHPTLASIMAMALVGISIQVKYTAFVEGIFFGLCLAWLEWDRRRNVAQVMLLMSLLVGTALAPTVAALAFYAARGFTSQFIQANFLSIFQVIDPKDGAAASNLVRDLLALLPFFAVALAGALVLVVRHRNPRSILFLFGWLVFASIGFAIIGRFYSHYFIPACVPLAILAAPALAHVVSLGSVVGLFIAVSWGAYVADAHATMIKYQGYMRDLTTTLAPYAKYGCLYLRNGPVLAYVETGSCLPTSYVFPDHLITVMESKATDAERSMAAVIASRPAAITVSTRSWKTPANPTTNAMLLDAIKAHYRLKAEIPEVRSDGRQLIYVRSDLP